MPMSREITKQQAGDRSNNWKSLPCTPFPDTLCGNLHNDDGPAVERMQSGVSAAGDDP